MTKATRSNSSLELDRLRTIMLTRTVYWLFTTIVIPSVRRAFYVTTSNDTRGKLEFFTWANWYKVRPMVLLVLFGVGQTDKR